MIRLYGIPNCDTVKKAKDHLYRFGVNDFEFINFKEIKPTDELILKWKRAYEGEWPINPKSRTFREIKKQFEEADELDKIQLIIQHSSCIKRPILEIHGKIISVGYNEARYAKAIKQREEI